MPLIFVEAQLSADEMLKAVEQMDLTELNEFVSDVLVLWARRQKIRLTAPEKELLQKIKQGVPVDMKKRYEELMVKRRAETLSAKEYRELLRLTNEVEKIEAKRLESLVELASLRGTALSTLPVDELVLNAHRKQ